VSGKGVVVQTVAMVAAAVTLSVSKLIDGVGQVAKLVDARQTDGAQDMSGDSVVLHVIPDQ